ncbi:hypothetical protein TNIN_71671 [Trichonephila inaurata madagascariensis]|uniref:Uncharacterized protein n=1 Tax=Trichonephila inaurata madagascariensis TaxID=2747483 RepID=A0A8X6YMU1_9ARAC|nr:hypothetical protein TNIN_71671 [Trichonephila inaurata madagascariensis]
MLFVEINATELSWVLDVNLITDAEVSSDPSAIVLQQNVDISHMRLVGINQLLKHLEKRESIFRSLVPEVCEQYESSMRLYKIFMKDLYHDVV